MKELIFELTIEGKEAFENELEELKSVARPKNIEALKAAREQGDLSENADYDAAREEQRRIEQRISELENILKNCRIIQSNGGNEVTIGRKVRVKYLNLEKQEEFYFDIVGTIEADPDNNKISNTSPLGKALLGHRVGDVVTFTVATGKTHKVEILEIE